jgi:hypothetical protein
LDTKKLQSLVVEARIEFGQELLKTGNADRAEIVLTQALGQAEHCKGKMSPLVGLALIALMELYDRKGRQEESEQTWQRIRSIMLRAVLQKHVG